MRTPLAVTMVMGAGLGTAGAALAADVPAQSKITAVVVFPSGAEVTRTAKVKIEPGEHTLVFADLPAQAIASSIRVEGRSSGKLEIGSVDTKRASVARADAANVATERRRPSASIKVADRARKASRFSAAERTRPRTPRSKVRPMSRKNSNITAASK